MIWSFHSHTIDETNIVLDKRPTIVTNEQELIIGISTSWVKMCGYLPNESFGSTPKLLQGPLTDIEATKSFSNQLKNNNVAYATFINYKKDGTPFRNSVVGWQHGDILIAQTYAESALYET